MSAVQLGSPSPKRRPQPTPQDSAKANKDSAVKETGRTIRETETARKKPRAEALEKTLKPKTTRRRKRKEGDWNYDETDKAYVLDPQKPDVHKYTWIYLHYLCGHPKEYFAAVGGFNAPGLKVVLPKAPVFASLHYGEGVKGSKSRLWYDYYHDPQDPKEDPSEGASAEELEYDSDEEKEMGLREDEPEEEENNEGDGDDDNKEDPGDAAEEKEPKLKSEKFAAFLNSLPKDSHPEINVPKEAQVEKSINRVVALIHKEAEKLGGDYSRIFLGGWSQGATVALCAAVHKDCPTLGGCLAITGTYHTKRVDDALKNPVKTTPFVLYVGVKDDTYPVMLLMPMVEKMRAAGFQIELREKNMDHNLNGNIGPAFKVEERWMKQYVEVLYQDSSLGALMKANCATPPLDAKELEAAVKVVYGVLFGNKVPHNRRAEIMKYSCWEGDYKDVEKAVKKLSDDDLSLVARFFGAESSCAREDLTCLLAAPTSTAVPGFP
jgi:predicted esterase